MRRVGLALPVPPPGDPAEAAEALKHWLRGRGAGGEQDAVIELGRFGQGREPLGVAARLEDDFSLGALVGERDDLEPARGAAAVEPPASCHRSRESRKPAGPRRRRDGRTSHGPRAAAARRPARGAATREASARRRRRRRRRGPGPTGRAGRARAWVGSGRSARAQFGEAAQFGKMRTRDLDRAPPLAHGDRETPVGGEGREDRVIGVQGQLQRAALNRGFRHG